MLKALTARKRIKAIHALFAFRFCLAMVALLTFGCAASEIKHRQQAVPPHKALEFPEFIAVIAQPEDTLKTLAETYLENPDMDWLIAEFNRITSVEPGQELIIPLKPFQRGGLTQRGYQTVPVLSYHKFSLNKKNRMTVTKDAFEEQMKLLQDRGYRVISMDQLFDFLDFKGQIPKKSVVITIDDGWRSAYDIAFPILKKYGFPATFFVYTDLIVGSKKTLSWNLLREMTRNGIDIQCHTKTHRNLTVIDEKESFREYFEAIERDLTAANNLISKKLDRTCTYLAYPYSDTNSLIIALLKKQGYRGAFTVKRGSNPFFINNYAINRSMIYGDYTIEQFEKNLTVFSDRALK
jgi:peptidoglycan/xylan/chitin deacetylase (PgdA/CDA1 family)